MGRLSTAYGVLAATDTVLAGLGPPARRWRRLTKPLLMPVLSARRLDDGRVDSAVRLTAAAQALSWGGDVALLGSGTRRLLTGVGSFLGAHLAYVAAFRERGSTALPSTPHTRAILAAGSVLACGNALAAGRRDRRLALPIGVYGAVLASMAASAAALPAGPGQRQVQAGAGLFLLSDSLLGLQLFIRARPTPVLEATVMATYTAGQWLISEGIAASHVG